MSKIDKSVLLPPALIAMLGLSGIATAAPSSQHVSIGQAPALSALELVLDAEVASQLILEDEALAGTQCTSYSSGGTHCGHYSSGDQQKELRLAHTVPAIKTFNV